MAYREIRIIGDPVLRTPCEEIHEIGALIKALVEDLLENIDMDGRAGLAANQIGVNKRTFSYNVDGGIGYVPDPRIVEVSEDEYQDGDEGCLSVPHLWYLTERAWYARVKSIDLDGKKTTLEGEELMARCLRHECDHLGGYIYIDRLDRKTHKKALRDIRNQEW